MNETIRKFGYPATLIREYDHWVVLLRPAQLTLGSLVLAAKSEATDFNDLSLAAFTELKRATAHINTALSKAVSHAKLNYLMLMMLDPHVHFHVFPRYEGERSAQATTFADASWPGPPDLSKACKLSGDQIEGLRGWLSGLWPDQ